MQWSMDPILVSIGALSIHWYGVLFACGVWFGAELVKKHLSEDGGDVELVDALFAPVLIGIIVGARLMHCLVYEPDVYLADPIRILYVWQGGLASHGGGLGALLAVLWIAKSRKLSLLYLVDRFAVPTLFFGACVRFGNLMNSEIIGNPTDVPWGVVFTRVDMLPRHPAQLYEALSYTVLALVLWSLRKSMLAKPGRLFAAFLLSVFTVRLLVEGVKVEQADYVPLVPMTVGQLLSLPFMAAGAWLWWRSGKAAAAKA